MTFSNRYYEFFKSTHLFMALVFVIFFFFHCDFRMSSWDYFIATAVIYTFCWLYSQCKTYFEHGVRHKARLTAESNDTVRIAIDTTMEWGPGQHIFLRFLTCGAHALTAHPFTICSVPQPGRKNTLVFYVKARGGVTGRLMAIARKNPEVQVPVLMDGPYGGIQAGKLEDFDRNLIIGGGAGAGLTLSMVEDFIRFSGSQAEKRQLEVIVATRDPGMRSWYTRALEDIAERQSCDSLIPGLSIRIHETFNENAVSKTESDEPEVEGGTKMQSVESKECNPLTSEIFGIQVFTGRPDLPAAMHQVASQEGISVGVVVCGPSSMTHDVNQAASEVQSQILTRKTKTARELWLHTESFSY
jgi:NAD(P)H-flavin reductase